MISGIILAAGAAKRMGRQKLLLELRNKPVLQWVLEAALAASLSELVCVVRELAPIRRKVSLFNERLRWIVNQEADKGQSSSLAAGLKAISSESQGALFMVGDQPLVSTELINGLIHLFEKSSALVVAPIFQGETRNPVLFHRDLFPELLGLTGDKGGKMTIEKHRGKASFLEWKEESPFLDIDVWEDYERLNRR